MFNRRILVTKDTVPNIISNDRKIMSYIEEMCFVNRRVRSFVQYTKIRFIPFLRADILNLPTHIFCDTVSQCQ